LLICPLAIGTNTLYTVFLANLHGDVSNIDLNSDFQISQPTQYLHSSWRVVRMTLKYLVSSLVPNSPTLFPVLEYLFKLSLLNEMKPEMNDDDTLELSALRYCSYQAMRTMTTDILSLDKIIPLQNPVDTLHTTVGSFHNLLDRYYLTSLRRMKESRLLVSSLVATLQFPISPDLKNRSATFANLGVFKNESPMAGMDFFNRGTNMVDMDPLALLNDFSTKYLSSVKATYSLVNAQCIVVGTEQLLMQGILPRGIEDWHRNSTSSDNLANLLHSIMLSYFNAHYVLEAETVDELYDPRNYARMVYNIFS
jgi:hypothetical protein